MKPRSAGLCISASILALRDAVAAASYTILENEDVVLSTAYFENEVLVRRQTSLIVLLGRHIGERDARVRTAL